MNRAPHAKPVSILFPVRVLSGSRAGTGLNNHDFFPQANPALFSSRRIGGA
jgi:hypothetical protein